MVVGVGEVLVVEQVVGVGAGIGVGIDRRYCR
jgi:hypothetical protein